ncbi:MAG: cupredoxin domain-containing protein [Candidatus Nitrosocosmicus sp.]
MTDMDLLMPGAGLTAVGAIGVALALSGISNTFLEGMHAVSLLCMFFGLIMLSGGLFKDGFPRSNKAKKAAAIGIAFFVIAGLVGAFEVSNRVPSILAFIGIVVLISILSLVIIIASHKRYPHLNKLTIVCISLIIIGSAAIISASWISSSNSVTAGSEKKTVDNSTQKPIPKVVNGQIVRASILPGASGQGNPAFKPAIINTKKGYAIEWTNNDNVPHTVTSFKDNGKSFDSSIIMPNKKFVLDTSTLKDTEYDYFCTIHPYMKGKFVIK